MNAVIFLVVLLVILVIAAIYRRYLLHSESRQTDIDALSPRKVSRRLTLEGVSIAQIAALLEAREARVSHRTDSELIAFLGSASRVKTMGIHTAADAKIPLRVFARTSGGSVLVGLDEDMGFQVGLPEKPFLRVMDALEGELRALS